jgi:hypothetical protein
MSHTTLQTEIGKRGNVVRKRAVRATGIAKKTEETLEMQGVLEYQEKESNLHPGLFSCIRRRRVTFILDFR